jgi:hypothetical protein
MLTGLVIPDESTGVQTFWVFSYRNALNRLLMIDTQSFIRLIDDVLKDKPTRWMTSKDLRPAECAVTPSEHS